MTGTFVRSREQRMEALVRANEVRSFRAGLKVDLKGRRVLLRDVLLGDVPELESMKVLALLLAAPRVGRVKANKVLRVAGVSPVKTVGGLSDRQRRELVALLPRFNVR